MRMLERVVRTREHIQTLKGLKERAERASEFEQRALTLSTIACGFNELCLPVLVLKEAGIPVPQLDEALLATVRTKAQQLKQAYEDNRSSVLNPFPEQDFRHVFVAPSNAFKQRTEVALKVAWSDWLKQKMPAIDHEVLNVLVEVNGLRGTVASIQGLLGRIGKFAATLPTSMDDVKEVLALCAQTNQVWHELAGDGIAPEVLVFLRAAGSGTGAPFDLLTPAILEWLDSHNLQRVLRVRLS